MTRIITTDELRMGDVFLCRGKSEISKLISWVGDSPYSHASLYDGEKIIEAAIPMSRTTKLDEALSPAAGYELIDVYRWADSADAPHLRAVIQRGDGYLNKPYGFKQLRLAVLAVAVRRKALSPVFPGWLVEVLRGAIESWIPDKPNEVVCSELVYRCFDEADTTPPHKMRPKIAIQGPGNRVWDVNVLALYREIQKIREIMGPTGVAGVPELAEPADASAIDDAAMAELEQRLAEIRADLGRDDSTFDPDVAADFVPNPQAVIPLDFETSPSFTKIGRLALK